MRRKHVAFVVLLSAAVTLTGCSGQPLPDGTTTVKNLTGEMIRVTGNCTPDDAQTLMPGDTTNDVYLGAQCRIDNGDGLDGMLACVTLSTRHTVITAADLKDPPSPDQCWGDDQQ